MVASLVLFLLSAQQASLRGTVIGAETRQPLGFSIVSLVPGPPTSAKRFTAGAGTFAFPDVAAGTYILSVRQIGYAPFDTQVVVHPETATTLVVELRRLAIVLPPVTIAGEQCTRPGRPDSSDAALAAVFDQLQENARRYQLLAESYPFRYDLELSEREINQRGDTGRAEVRKIRFQSSDNRPYAVGRVVEPGWWPWGPPDRVLVIRSAELQDLGNADFIANHCFRLAGRDTIEGQTLVRIDFEPAARIRSADMAGAAYLDSTTYELRYTETSLTKPEQSALSNVRSMTFRTRFRNIAPGVPLQDSLTVTTTYRYGKRASIGTQRTVDVQFRRQPPHPL